MDALLGLQATPPLLFTSAMLLLLVVVRSPWPWTRLGGTLLSVATLAAMIFFLGNSRVRHLLADPERLPTLLLILASGAFTWVAFHQARDSPALESRRPAEGGVPARWHGLSPVELLAGGAAVLGAAILAAAFGAPLAAPIDLSRVPEDLAAPWFLLGFQELGGFFDPWVSLVLLPALALLGLVALPYLDVPAEKPQGAGFEERREIVAAFLFVWFLLGLLPMLFAAFLGPGEPGADAPRPLSELAWGLVLEEPPRLAPLRELPGLLLLGLYFGVLPRQLPRWKPTRALFGRYLKRLGRPRFHLAMAFMLLWMLVPLKMYGRWLLGIGSFVHLPELPFNF